jgi:hypothetical protein
MEKMDRETTAELNRAMARATNLIGALGWGKLVVRIQHMKETSPSWKAYVASVDDEWNHWSFGCGDDPLQAMLCLLSNLTDALNNKKATTQAAVDAMEAALRLNT